MLQAEEEDDEQRDEGGDADAADALAAAIEGQEQDDREPDLVQARKKKALHSLCVHELAQLLRSRTDGCW